MSIMKTAAQCRDKALLALQRAEEALNPHSRAHHVALSGEWMAMARMADLHDAIEADLALI